MVVIYSFLLFFLGGNGQRRLLTGEASLIFVAGIIPS